MKILSILIFLTLSFPASQNLYSFSKHRHKTSAAADTGGISQELNLENSIRPDRLTWYQMFTHLPSDYYRFFTNTFASQNIPKLAAFAALTGSLFFADQAGWQFNRNTYTRSKFIHKTADVAVIMGNGEYQFIGSALFAASGIVFHDRTALKTGSNIAEAILATGLFVQLLKRITGRESPIVSTEKGGEWDFFPSIKEYQKHQPEYYSFPSGHLSTATAIFTVIANNYPDSKWIKPVGYSLLGILGISLVDRGMHWYSDLPIAYFLGYSFGNIIAPVKNNDANKIDNTSLSVLPSITYNGLQLQLSYSF